MVCSFFLGANTPRGFYSLFDQLSDFDVSVIKGGSGSGKSTLIKELINKTCSGGLCERIPCASDTDSLDGAVFHGDNIAVVDGTPPHTCEVGGMGRYIVTPPPDNGVKAKHDTLIELKEIKQRAYARAYGCLHGASIAEAQARQLIGFDSDRFVRRVDGILLREAAATGSRGKIHRRFIDGFTCDGFVTLRDTVSALAHRLYIIQDRLGLASGFFKALEDGLCAKGYEIFSCMSPMQPQHIRHIIVPALDLAFVTSDDTVPFEEDAYRNIHISSCIDKDSLRKNRAKLRLFDRLRQELVQQAYEEFKAARAAHAEIEGIYRPYLDIEALRELNRRTVLK